MKLNIYACGGTGINIATRLAHHHNQQNPGFADIQTYFIDTSRSNLSKDIPDERVYIFKDQMGKTLDGNGKFRRANNDVISDASNMEAILHQFPIGDFNIVIGSASGGTGSIVGPYLAKELLKRKANTIVLLVGSTTSKLDTENTLKTLKTYESLAMTLETPINVLYRENSPLWTRKQIDIEMERYLLLLAAFFSGQNHGLDTADLRNMLNYSIITPYKPRMTAIDLFVGKVVIPKDALAITSVSLTPENEDIQHDFLVDIQYSGVMHTAVADKLQKKSGEQITDSLHAVIFSNFFTEVVNNLEKLLNEYSSKEKRMGTGTIMGADKANDDGIVL